jgi:N-acetylmuramoyl-L-alanine amidase
MTKTVGIFPSTQERNLYATGGTEEYVMRQLAAEVYALLHSSTADIKLVMGGVVSWQENVALSNKLGVQYHYALHTNAGGGHGTEAFFKNGSVVGKRIATKVYNRVAPVSNFPDRGVKGSDVYGELNGTHGYATIIEILFHDNALESAEMKRDIHLFAVAIAQGILDEVGGTLASAKPPVAVPNTFRHVAGWAEDAASRKEIEDLCESLGKRATFDGPAFEFHSNLVDTKKVEAAIAANPKLHRFNGVVVASGTYVSMGIAKGIGDKPWSVTVG